MAQEQAVASKQSLREFTVEFGNDSGHQITINTLQLTVRGRWSIARLMSRSGGFYRGCRAPMPELHGMPDIPGMRMKIIPRTRTAVLYDPLEQDSRLMDRISEAGAAARLRGLSAWRPNESSEHKLNEHKFKSLVHDLSRLAGKGDLTVLEGEMPTEEQIEDMPGDRLYDPWSNSPGKPIFVKDVPAWHRNIDRNV